METTDLGKALEGFAAVGVRGFNVTIPHKQAIVPYLHHITPLAQAVGAVNTVWATPQGWQGTNTDVQGFVSPLKRLDQLALTTAIVLGNGGASRAVVAGCGELGFQRVVVVGRHAKKLDAFCKSGLQTSLPSTELQVALWDQLPHYLPQASLVVNTTPLGMAGVPGTPLDHTQVACLSPGTIVYDLIYTPSPTPLLQSAQTHGLSTIDGVEMLVQQGAAALHIWTGAEVPIATMERVLRQHLGLS